jgi:hypothetical protein
MRGGHKSGGGGHHKRSTSEATLNNITQDNDTSLPCNGCGWTDICVDYAHCHFKSHPGYNKDKTKSWAASNNGKSYKVAKCEDKKGQTAGRDQLSFYHHPCGKKMTEIEMKALIDAGMTKPKRLSKKPQNGSSSGGKRKLTDYPFDILATYATTKDESYLRPFSILCRQEKATKVGGDSRSKKVEINQDIKVNALIDTGALKSSYISLHLAKKLHKLGLMKIQTKQRVCSGINNTSCTNATASYDLTLSFVNERTLNEELLVLRAQVIDCRFDLIIGQPDIFFYDIIEKFPSLFSRSWTESHDSRMQQADEQPIMRAVDGSACAECTCSHVVTNPSNYEPPVVL